MYKIYINERPLRFISASDPVDPSDNIIRLNGVETPEQLKVIVSAFESDFSFPSLSLLSPDMDNSWKTFCSNYSILEAAGGVVVNPEGAILMIFRNGKWDLPKGKIEQGEDPETAAVREVNEECGIGKLILRKQLSTTFHTYPFKDKKILKKTYWYQMKSDDFTLPVPQLEEGITEVVWKTRIEVLQALSNAYESIAHLLKEEILSIEQGIME
ncbi:NUDIX domain-containing protein [soil metagenome]